MRKTGIEHLPAQRFIGMMAKRTPSKSTASIGLPKALASGRPAAAAAGTDACGRDDSVAQSTHGEVNLFGDGQRHIDDNAILIRAEGFEGCELRIEQ